MPCIRPGLPHRAQRRALRSRRVGAQAPRRALGRSDGCRPGALLARRAGRAAGAWAALLLAFAPFHVRYSQEFRPYALGLLLLSASLLALDRFLERPGRLRLAVPVPGLPRLGVHALPGCGRARSRSPGAPPGRCVLRRRRSAASLAPRSGLEPYVRRRALARIPAVVACRAGGRSPNGACPGRALHPRARRKDAVLLRIRSKRRRPLSMDHGHLVRRSSRRCLSGLPAGGPALPADLAERRARRRRDSRLRPSALVRHAALSPGRDRFPDPDRPGDLQPSENGNGLLRRRHPPGLPSRVRRGGLARYFREGRADWRPLAHFLAGRPASEQIFTENQYAQALSRLLRLRAGLALARSHGIPARLESRVRAGAPDMVLASGSKRLDARRG